MASSRSTSTQVGNRRVRLDPADRREQILVAAQRLFAAHPYAEVSTTDLAIAAGTTRTNLHYYFGSKRELYLGVLRRFGQLPQLPRGPGRATGPAELRRLFARWLDVLEDNPQTIMTMIGAGAAGSDREVEMIFRDGLRAWEDHLLAVLELADDQVNRAIIRSFQGMVTSAIAEWLQAGTVTKQQVHSLLVRTLLAAVQV